MPEVEKVSHVDSVYLPVKHPASLRGRGLGIRSDCSRPIHNQRNPIPVLTKVDGTRTKIKRGFRAMGVPKICGISFDIHPVWLWTLRPSEWNEVWMSEETNLKLMEMHLETGKRFAHLIKTFHEGSGNDVAVGAADVWWISGSQQFVEVPLTRIGSCPCVSSLTRAPRRTPKSTSEEDSWYSVCHRSVGGVTNARGYFDW